MVASAFASTRLELLAGRIPGRCRQCAEHRRKTEDFPGIERKDWRGSVVAAVAAVEWAQEFRLALESACDAAKLASGGGHLPERRKLAVELAQFIKKVSRRRWRLELFV